MIILQRNGEFVSSLAAWHSSFVIVDSIYLCERDLDWKLEIYI